MIDYLSSIDTKIFLFLNGMNSPFWDAVMYLVSGKFTWIPFYLVIIFFIARKFKWNTLWIIIAIALIVTLSDQLSVHAFKNVFQRLRPCHDPMLSGFVHIVGRCGGKFGFVSSHASNTFGVAVFLLLLFRVKWFSIVILLWATVVSYSRIYLGVHFPGDVLVGALLGVCIGFLVWKTLEFASKRYDILSSKEEK